MRTPEEWMRWHLHNHPTRTAPLFEVVEAIQKDALSDPMAQTLDQHELEMVKDIAENLEYQLQVRTQELAEMREKWHEARKHLRAANKGAERNAVALQLAASRINSISDPLEARVWQWLSSTDEDLRLRMGELTSQEIRNIRACLRAILGTSKLSKHTS
jgi:hypothetical protein